MPVVGGNAVAQLQGKIAGANVVSASGRPGDAPAVVLRGPSSINASGRSQGPMYIVDGVVLNGATPDLNPNDIENIEVVKGAAAASLYGSRAGGGVINITTKSGRNAGEGVKFGVRAEVGMNDIANEFDIARQTPLAFDPAGQYYCAAVASGGSPCARYVDMETERYRVNNVTTPHSLSAQTFLNDGGIASNLLRYRLLNLFQANSFPSYYNVVRQATRTDLWQNLNADVRGKVENTGFFASVGHSRQKGAFEFLDGYSRTTGRLNLDQRFGEKLTMQATSFYSVQSEDGGNQENGTGFFRLSRQPGFVNMFSRDDQGRLYIRSNPLNQGVQNANPLYYLEQNNRQNQGTRFLGSAQTRYTATDWLDFSADFAYDRGTSNAFTLNDRGFRTTQEDLATAVGFISTSSGDSRSMNMSVGATARPQLVENLATTISARLLYDKQDGWSNSNEGENIAVPGLISADAAIANFDIGSSQTEEKAMSYFGGIDFDYLDRYILNFSLRREGSSRFGADNRWATFPRVAGAWIASQEPWWPAAEALSLVKFRAAWGQAGQRPSRTAQYETYSVTSTGALSPVTLGNKELKPEILTEVEVGTDMELFGRYGLNLTYAQSRADDQILLVPAPAASGFPNQWRNAGQLQNKTFEASLDIPLINNADMRWSTRLIYDRNRAEITRLDVPCYNTTGGFQGTESMYYVCGGERLGTMYGRKFVTECSELPGTFGSQCGGSGAQFQRNSDGFIVWTGGRDQSEGITNNLWNSQLNYADAPWGSETNQASLVWGMPIRLRDDDGNVRQVPLGNGTPDYHAAVSTNFSWRKLSAYALFDGSFGREVFNEGYQWALGDFMTGSTDQGGRSVQSAKPLGYYFRAGSGLGGSSGVGGLYDVLGANNHSAEDASFVKLREVTLTYNVGAIGGQGNWTVGLVGRNLLTFTDYRGYDPEVGNGGGQLNSAALNAVDYFNFPNLRTFTIQLSTAF
jgi:TonB-linked SusC/RagA family outer membrane protein